MFYKAKSPKDLEKLLKGVIKQRNIARENVKKNLGFQSSFEERTEKEYAPITEAIKEQTKVNKKELDDLERILIEQSKSISDLNVDELKKLRKTFKKFGNLNQSQLDNIEALLINTLVLKKSIAGEEIKKRDIDDMIDELNADFEEAKKDSGDPETAAEQVIDKWVAEYEEVKKEAGLSSAPGVPVEPDKGKDAADEGPSTAPPPATTPKLPLVSEFWDNIDGFAKLSGLVKVEDAPAGVIKHYLPVKNDTYSDLTAIIEQEEGKKGYSRTKLLISIFSPSDSSFKHKVIQKTLNAGSLPWMFFLIPYENPKDPKTQLKGMLPKDFIEKPQAGSELITIVRELYQNDTKLADPDKHKIAIRMTKSGYTRFTKQTEGLAIAPPGVVISGEGLLSGLNIDIPKLLKKGELWLNNTHLANVSKNVEKVITGQLDNLASLSSSELNFLNELSTLLKPITGGKPAPPPPKKRSSRRKSKKGSSQRVQTEVRYDPKQIPTPRPMFPAPNTSGSAVKVLRPDELMPRLEVLYNAAAAGNNNVRAEAMGIIDNLLDLGNITVPQFKDLRNLFV